MDRGGPRETKWCIKEKTEVEFIVVCTPKDAETVFAEFKGEMEGTR